MLYLQKNYLMLRAIRENYTYSSCFKDTCHFSIAWGCPRLGPPMASWMLTSPGHFCYCNLGTQHQGNSQPVLFTVTDELIRQEVPEMLPLKSLWCHYFHIQIQVFNGRSSLKFSKEFFHRPALGTEDCPVVDTFRLKSLSLFSLSSMFPGFTPFCLYLCPPFA